MRRIIALAAALLIAELVGAHTAYEQQLAPLREIGYGWAKPSQPQPYCIDPALLPAGARIVRPARPPGIDLPARMVYAPGHPGGSAFDDDAIQVNEADVRAENARLAQEERDSEARQDAMERAGTGLGDRRR